MELTFGNGVLLLLLIASMVAMLTRRLGLPYSVGLVVAGIVMALLPWTPKYNLTRELVFDVLLPPLIFEAAFYIRWDELRRQLPVVLTLASVGVVLSGAVTAAGMHFAAGWPWPASVVFGSLIAATDPVAVIATFRDAKVHGRLRLLIESESLLNDGTAAVAFGLTVLFATGHELTAVQLVEDLAAAVAGALLCGGLVGALALYITKQTEDHLVELTFTTVAAYGSFLFAEHFHFSGVFATITAGLIIGNHGQLGHISDQGRQLVQAFWEYAAFVANSFIFLLIGMHLANQHFESIALPIFVAIAFVLLGRAVAVYPICPLFSRTRLTVSLRHQNALFWGGLRGALALALALGLPEELSGRADIITVSFAVVAFSVFVQGLTMPPLLRAIGEIAPKPAR